jgi:hypothetical protein
MLQKNYVEIDHESNPTSGSPQVTNHLGHMDWVNAFHRLDLQDQQLFNEEIYPLLADQSVAVPNRNGPFPVVREPSGFDFDAARA